MFLSVATQMNAQQPNQKLKPLELLGRYFRLLEAGTSRVQKLLQANPNAPLSSFEQQPYGHFPHAIVLPAVLFIQMISNLLSLTGNVAMARLDMSKEMLLQEN